MSDLILTATDRLARALREDASLAQRGQGRAVWEAPQIKSLSRWVLDAWTASWPAELLLHPGQELALWRELIEHDEAGAQLLAPLAAAREARRADQQVRRYAIDLARAPVWREEHQAFRRWRTRFDARLRREGWITAADLPAAVAAGVRAGRIQAPPNILLCGFVETPPPAERELLAALAAAGSHIESSASSPAATQILRERHADAEAQFRAIALDIRERLRPHADHRTPPPRIVVALPDPEARRELIETVFRGLLAPWMNLADAGPRAAPWRWESGQPLAEQPWVDAALALAELQLNGNEPAAISRLLLSCALWTPEQRALAAEADHRLREAGLPSIRLERLSALLPPPLRERLEALAQVLQSAPRRALPSDWLGHWQARASALGWPDNTPLDSAAYQSLREWQRLQLRYAAMDRPLGRVPAGEALSWLRELARSARPEPRVDHLQPVLILRYDEAAGLPCDVLYLADASLDRYPGPARPTPFLAPEVQIAVGLPGASPALQLEQARRLAQHLLTLAPDIRIGLPGVDERGAELRPTPLFGEEQAWQAGATQRIASRLERDTAAGPRLCVPEADPAPAVDASERAGLRADSALFRAWFESPFFAFCIYRLGIRSLPRPGRGLDARGQGTLAHAVLRDVWETLGSSRELQASDDARLQLLVETGLDRWLPQLMPAADYGRVQLRLERARQADVLAQWLAHERRRVDGFTVELAERRVETVLAGLALRLQIDRIDRVQTPQGERWLVIDYKTGAKAETRGWESDRLAEPQLPLYASHAVSAAAGVPQVDGICFGHLKDGHPALVAITNWRQRLIDADSGKVHPNWDEQLVQWRVALERAAQGFLAGEAGLADDIGARSYYADLLTLAGRGGDEE